MSEVIGGVAVTAELDFSAIQPQLDQLASIVSSGMDTLNSAISEGLKAPDTSQTLESIQDIADKAKDVAQQVTDAFANVEISMPTGSLISDSAAADIAKEIAQAFESTPISLSINTDTAGSAATDVAAEIATAFASVEIPAPDLSAFTDSLSSLGDAAAQEAEQISQDFAGIQIAGPDTSGITDVSGGSLAAPDISAVTETLSQVDTEAAAAVDTMVQDFAGATLEAPDTSGVTDAITGVDDTASTSADQMVQDFSGAQLAAPDVTAVTDALTQIDTDATTAADQLAQDLSGVTVQPPDFGPVTGALDQLLGSAETAGEQFIADFAAGLDTSDLSAFTSAMDQVVASLGQAEGGPAKEFADQITAIVEAAQQAVPALEGLDGALGGIPPDPGAGLNEFSDAAQAVIDKQNDLESTMAQAQATLQELETAYEQGAISAGTLELAQIQLQSATDAAEHSVEEEESGLKDLAEAMTGFGEALAITEGLKELGSEALGASDGITKASIALTAITGDGEAAEATIKGLENLGISDGLSMPALLTAGTRMQQLLPEGTDVVGLLKNIADGAQTMGTEIGAAANSFDRIVNSGTVAARQLQQIGLNMGQLADALNAVNPALNATADDAAAAFKALDPGDRIAVLQSALQQLGGTAQAMAQQVFGLQWQSLSNQWEQIMAQVGSVLAPVTSELVSFSQGVLSVVKGLAEEFATLPTPVKDAAGAFLILAGSVIPVAGAIGAISLAIEPLGGLFVAAEAAIGGMAGAVGIGEGALEAFGAAIAPEVVVPLGLIAAAISAIDFAPLAKEFSDFFDQMQGIPQVTDAWTTFKGVIDGVATDVQADFTNVSSGAKDLINQLADFGADVVITNLNALKEAINALLAPLGDVKVSTGEVQSVIEVAFTIPAALDLLNAGIKALSATVGEAKAAWDTFTGDIQNSSGALAAAQTALGNLNAANAQMMAGLASQASGFSDATAGVNTYSDATQALIAKQVSLVGNLGDAQAVLSQIKAAYDNGQVSAQVYQAALTAVDSATTALYGHQQQLVDTSVKLAEAMKDLVDNTKAAGDASQVAAAGYDALQSKVALTTTQLDHANANLITANDQLKDIITNSDGSQESLNNIASAEQRVSDAATKAAAAQKALNDAIAAANAADAKAALDVLATSLGDILTDAETAETGVKNLGIDIRNLGDAAPALSPVNQALIDLGMNARTAKPDVDTLLADMKTLEADPGTSWDALATGIGKFDQAIQQLAKTDLPDATNIYGKFVQSLEDSNAPLSLVQTALGTYEGYINKLAKTDLPDAISEQSNYIAQLGQINAPISQIITATETWDKWQIQLAQDSGASSAAYIYNLEAMQLQQQQLATNAAGMATSVVGAINDVNKGFDSLGQSIGAAILAGNNLGDALVTALKKIAATILGDLIQGALTPLKSALMDLEKTLLSGLDGGLNAAQQGINSLSGAASQTATQMASMETSISDVEKNMETLAGDTTQTAGDMAGLGDAATQTSDTLGKLGTQQGQAGSGLIGSLQNLTNIISLVAQVIAAGAAVVGDVYLAAIDTKLFTIETDEHGILNEALNFRADQWTQFNQDYQRQGEILNELQTGLGNIYQAVLLIGTGSGGSSSGSTDVSSLQSDLDTIASNSSLLVQGDVNINDSVIGVFNAVNSVHDELVAIDSYLEVIDTSINGVITAIDYGGSGLKSSMAQQTSQLISAGGEHAGSIVNGLDTVTQTIQQQITAAQQQLAADQAAAQSATNTADEITALQSELKDLQALSALELQNGNNLMATVYQTQAQTIAGQITNLGGTVTASGAAVSTSVATGTGNVTTAVTSGLNGVQATQGVTSQNIVTAVNNAAGAISGAVTSAMAGVGASLMQNIPRGGGGVNSSGGATAGQPAGAGVSQTSIPIPAAPFPGTGGMALPNAPTQNGVTPQPQQFPAGSQGTAVPLNYNPATGANPGSGTQIIPALAGGGFVDQGGAAHVDTGEYMLNPGQVSAFLTAMTGPAPTGLEALAGAINGTAQTAAQTAGEQTQKLLDQLKTLQQELTTAVANGAAVEVYELKNQIAAVQTQLGANPVLGPGDTGNAQAAADAATANAAAAATAAATQSTATSTASTASSSTAVQVAINKLANDQQNLAQAMQSGNQQAIANAQQVMAIDEQNLTLAQDAAASAQQTASNTDAIQIATNKVAEDQKNLLAAMQSGNQQAIADAHAALDVAIQNLQVAQQAAAAKSAPTLPTQATGALQNVPGPVPLSGPQANTAIPWGSSGALPVTPHASFSGYNPYGASQPFLAGSFAMGGPVGADGIYQLHANEFVFPPTGQIALPPDVMSRIQMPGSLSLPNWAPPNAGAGAQGGGGGVVINAPVTFNGVTNAQQMAQMFTQHLKTAIPRGGGFNG